LGNDPAEVTRMVDHLFRREAGRLVAILARRFGGERLHLAEDVVQDALLKAMQTWPFAGIPDNPTAWIFRVACNRALDQTRREQRGRAGEPEWLPFVEDSSASATGEGTLRFEDEIRDSQLRMMFVCCHPGLPVEGQIALMLKILCGFGESEIAAAFLTSEAAIAKRLVRTRQFLRERRIAVELPPVAELVPRLDAVLQALYLLFNEGYKASHGNALLRRDLCQDAIRLGELLTVHPVGDTPATHALLALMYFNAARLPARIGADGTSLRFSEQERGLWDRKMIRQGALHLEASGGGAHATTFHLEAGIAACHALPPDDAGADWTQILALYDDLFALNPSPIVALNRAVAVAKVRGPAEGLRSLATMRDRASLENYHLLHAVEGQLWLDSGAPEKAVPCLQRAHGLATIEAERTSLARRMALAQG
jgi:RNA polymerase sigma factor (sigma-70 family)